MQAGTKTTKIRPKQWVILQCRKVHHRGEVFAAIPVQPHWNQCGCMATREDSLWHSIPRGQKNRAVTSLVLSNIWKMFVSESNEQLTWEMPVFISECLPGTCPHSCADELCNSTLKYCSIWSIFEYRLSIFWYKLQGKKYLKVKIWREGQGEELVRVSSQGCGGLTPDSR